MICGVSGNTLATVHSIDGNALLMVCDIAGNSIAVQQTDGAYYVGDTYAFSAMSMTDESNIGTLSAEHTKRADNTVLLTANGDESTVSFACDIAMNGMPNVGLWIWTDRLTKGGYDISVNSHECQIAITVGNTTKKFSGKSNDASLKSGMNYYLFTKNEVGADTISNIIIKVTGASGGTFYLDSVEVGFRMVTPHVLLNLDSSGRNFYSVGYPLFKKYGLTATFDYNISNDDVSVGASSGSWTDEADAQKHFEMVADGFDYGSYSGWAENEGTRPTSMDDETYYNAWFEHGQRMFALNNVFGIYAPSTVHCNTFKSGEIYQRAMLDAGFLCVRTDAKSLSAGATYLNEFSFFDGEDYREITPYYLGDCWDANSGQIASAKQVLSHCVRTGQNCMIMMHTIMESGYDHTNDTLNVGYDAIEELLKNIKEYVEAGKLKCSTTAEFMKEVAPTIHAEWYEKRKQSTVY